jgi:hypothetical protein
MSRKYRDMISDVIAYVRSYVRSPYKWYQPSYGGCVHYFELFGFNLSIRVESPDFKDDIETITNAIDDKYPLEDVQRMCRNAERKWGSDPELIQLETYAEFQLSPLQ